MNNFILQKREKINENNYMNIYNHESGLEVIYLKNSDENRVFSPCFKTLGENDKGVAHILEHCILCGSQKFPIKDPFNELTKGTLNTYLNAITYRDKTIYPIGSKIESEFKKMFEVYIDGVFAPLLREEAFMLEGIRKDISEKKYNGIVYNEMLSAYNDADSRLMEQVFKLLFPDNNYKYNSAGDPDEIEKLTYEEFLDYYKKYYNKSNCILYFYGDLEIDEYLEYIENNYLHSLDKKENISFEKQKPVISHFSIEDDLLNEQNYYAISYVINEDREIYYGYEFNILMDYLLGDDSSPLYKFLIENFPIEDIDYEVDCQLYQNVFTLILKSKKIIDIKNLKNSINNFLEKHIKEGFNYKAIDSQINSFKFSIMEEDYGYKPKGLGYFLHLMDFWLYSKERDISVLPINLDISKIRTEISNGTLEKMLVDEIILSKHYCTIEFLATTKNLQRLIKNVKITDKDLYKDLLIKKYLAKDDSQLVKDLIKIIPLDKIPIDLTQKSYIDYIDEKEIVFVKPFNDKISYYTFNIEIIDVDFNLLGLYIELFGQLSTKKNLIENLNMEIDNYIGDFQISFDSFIKEDKIKYFVIIEVKILNEYIEKSYNLVTEILTDTIFKETDLIRRKINEAYMDLDEELKNDNQDIGINRCFSSFFYENKVIDDVEGVSFFYYLKMIKEFDNKKLKVLISDLENLKDIIVNESSITYGVCSSEEKKFIDLIKKNQFLKKNIITKNTKMLEDTLKKHKKERIKIKGNNNTNIMCGKIFDEEYTSKWNVFANIVKNNYLNKEIRIVGGAYGYGFEILRDNKYLIYSANDPNVEKTFNTFKQVDKYMLEENISDENMKKYIVGTIGEVFASKSDYDKYFLVVSKHLRGITEKNEEKVIKDILDVTFPELKKMSKKLFYNIESRSIFTIGN